MFNIGYNEEGDLYQTKGEIIMKKMKDIKQWIVTNREAITVTVITGVVAVGSLYLLNSNRKEKLVETEVETEDGSDIQILKQLEDQDPENAQNWLLVTDTSSDLVEIARQIVDGEWTED